MDWIFRRKRMTEREQEARKLTEKARELNLLIGRSSMILGGVYMRVAEGKLWREAGFVSFEAWLVDVGDLRRSQAYALIDVRRELEGTVPEQEINRMPYNNARDLTKVPERKRTTEMIAAACELPNRKFREYANAKVPGGLHLDEKDYKGFVLHAGALKVVEQAIALAREQEHLETDGAALEFICAQYLAGEPESPQYRAARQLVEKVQDKVDGVRVPKVQEWGEILKLVSAMQDAFRFEEDKSKPTPMAQ
jgi:hypothetical protein